MQLVSIAIRHDNEEITKLLLNRLGEHNLDGTDQYSQTALFCAAQKENETIVRLLLQHGRPNVNAINAFSHTPLTIAIEKGNLAIFQLLLDTKRANLNVKNFFGRTPLSIAAKAGYKALVKLILKNTEFSYWTLLDKMQFEDEVKEWYMQGSRYGINSKDNASQTTMHHAVQGGHEAIVRLLLGTNMTKIDAKGRFSNTAADYAVRRGHKGIFRLLLDYGSKFNNSRNTSARMLYIVRLREETMLLFSYLLVQTRSIFIRKATLI